MNFETVRIMDIPFLNTSKSELMSQMIIPCIEQKQTCFIVTANPEIVMKAREDESYKKVLQSADGVIADGSGILLAAKVSGTPLQERIPGYELMVDMLAHANENRLSVYFLGAKADVNTKAVAEARKRYPFLEIAGHKDGFVNLTDDTVANEVADSGADIILAALGMPRQEKWIAQHRQKFNKGVMMGVGGSFDVLAGEVKRAPQKWINLNLEWLYRVLKQPSRIKRLMKVFEFVIHIMFSRRKKRNNA